MSKITLVDENGQPQPRNGQAPRAAPSQPFFPWHETEEQRKGPPLPRKQWSRQIATDKGLESFTVGTVSATRAEDGEPIMLINLGDRVMTPRQFRALFLAARELLTGVPPEEGYDRVGTFDEAVARGDVAAEENLEEAPAPVDE